MGDPAAQEHSAPLCDAALGQAFALLGKRWNGVILGSLMQGPAGFVEVRRATGISDSVLADRLAELTAAGLVVREVEEGPPVSVHYRLAPPGTALVPVLNDLMAWARDHLDARGQA
ncbi:MAG: putative transcriptional regulator, ArsR family protein [Marmoricola sp.]|nr:putative transcriptional regulator, ArsR family protein [Marmoricola sp.]